MRVLPWILMTSILFGCTNTTKVPNDILPKAKMEVVLWDIIQAERFSSLYVLKDSAKRNVHLEKFKLYHQVFALHKVSKDDFIKSYKYYLGRPDMAKVIVDSMAAKAERQREASYKAVPLK